jgi:hypothetical protein
VIFVVNWIHSGVVFTGEANPAGLVGGKLIRPTRNESFCYGFERFCDGGRAVEVI